MPFQCLRFSKEVLSKGGVVVSYHFFVCFLDLILRSIFAHTKKFVIVGTHDDEEGVSCIVEILPGGKVIWRRWSEDGTSSSSEAADGTRTY
jgi:hypothetical protein